MERYDYFFNVCKDVRNYIAENGIEVNQDNREEVEERLNDDLFVCDSVTGNGSGSYFFNAWKAEEALTHNWELLAEAIDEFGCSTDVLRQGPEAADVTIRCYLLSQAISAVLDEMTE